MGDKNNIHIWIRCCISIFAIMWVLTDTESASAEWYYGIGLGLFRETATGDLGFDTKIAGHVKLDIELNQEDIDNVKGAAAGFGGYATDGNWTITYAFVQAAYVEDTTYTTSEDTFVQSDVDADSTNAEITVGRNIFKSEHIILGILGGVNYTAHAYSFDLKINDLEHDLELDNSWTDVLIGANLSIPISRKWIWNNTCKIGFGGSNGSFFGSTGVTWSFAKHWSAGVLAKYSAVDYENGKQGDSDWYLYDMDVYGYGLTIFFNW